MIDIDKIARMITEDPDLMESGVDITSVPMGRPIRPVQAKTGPGGMTRYEGEEDIDRDEEHLIADEEEEDGPSSKHTADNEMADLNAAIKQFRQKKREKVVADDQRKAPNRKMIRKQSSYPSSFGKTKSFGGRGGGIDEAKSKRYIKLRKGMEATVLKDFYAHDGVTKIGKGEQIKVVDPARSLPDIKIYGTTISVDHQNLVQNIKVNPNFKDRLNDALENKFSPKVVTPDVLGVIRTI